MVGFSINSYAINYKLTYFIDFQPKMPFLFLGSILKQAIRKPIEEGLAKLAQKYNNAI